MIVSWQNLLLSITIALAFIVCCFLTGAFLIRLLNYNRREPHIFDNNFLFWGLVHGFQLSKEENAYLFVAKYGVRYVSVGPERQLFKSLSRLVNDSIELSNGWRIYSLTYEQE